MGAMLTQMYAKEHKNPVTAAIEICESLSASYPEKWWSVGTKWSEVDSALRVKKGVGESAEWNKIGQSHIVDFYVCTVPIAQLQERGGKLLAEKERKAKEIIESVEGMFRQKEKRVNFESIADEVVSRLDKEGLNWVHICISAKFYERISCSEVISRCFYSYANISESRQISIFLTA